MKRSTLFLSAVLLAISLPAAAGAAVVTLVDEDFTAGSAIGATWTSAAVGVSNGQQWTWSPLSGETSITTEVYGAGGAGARGLTTTYDHDQNGGTPAILVPGGFEVMSLYTSNGLPDSLRVAVQITLPTTLDISTAGLLTFFTENRIQSGSGGNAPRYAIRNITDARDIVALTAPSQPTIDWNFQSVAVNFIAADAGDVIQIWFQESITSGSAAGGRGLEIADVTFTASVLPQEVAVSGNSIDIADSDVTPSPLDGTDFGVTGLGDPVSMIFRVDNTGGVALTTSGLTVPGGFSIIEGLSASIAPGGFDTFTVQLDALATGAYGGQISFTNNDSNENPFNFSVQGIVVPAPAALPVGLAVFLIVIARRRR